MFLSILFSSLKFILVFVKKKERNELETIMNKIETYPILKPHLERDENKKDLLEKEKKLKV